MERLRWKSGFLLECEISVDQKANEIAAAKRTAAPQQREPSLVTGL